MIPTIILTGFLGAGKTTLLNRLIDYYQSQRAVLLINEFGQVGIDGELLKAGNYEKIELNKGSLFCICVRSDFITEVEKIATEIEPDLLIIEATGLADTSEMERMLALPNLRQHIRLKACIAVVDPLNFIKISTYLKAPVSQVQHADLVIINKTDLVGDQDIAATEKAIRNIVPDIPVFKTTYADIPAAELDKINRTPIPESDNVGEGRPDPVISLTLEGKGSLSAVDWKKLSKKLQQGSLRVKGFITIEDQVYQIDATAEQWREIRSLRPDHHNRLVVIGQKVPQQEIKELFYSALSAPNK